VWAPRKIENALFFEGKNDHLNTLLVTSLIHVA
jgi:hypothetical protein